MDPREWKELAADYDANVLSVYEHDHEGKISSLIHRLGQKKKTAADLGCGVGKFLPLLSSNFGNVCACDYSTEMIQQAKDFHHNIENLKFDICDLRSAPPQSGPFDFILCVNVILSPSLKAREKMWRYLTETVRPGGHIVLVVPSLESALYARHRLVEWNIRSGISPQKALKEGFEEPDQDGAEIARGGVVNCGGVPTKHYLEQELISTASRFKLRIKNSDKIEYPWSTEFNSPPRWMSNPQPWDWLILLQKI